jgi:hypothetical protein
MLPFAVPVRWIARLAVLAPLLLLSGPLVGSATAQLTRLQYDNFQPLTFYVVKGRADACGPGCDSWIAVEGKVDSSAAARFRKFLKQVGDRHLPMYFHSPGGNLKEAIAIGEILRERKVVARVGRTVVQECGFEPQDSGVCLKLKQSSRELHGDVWTRDAVCNSACPYLILGAATREIAPDATLGVHSPRVFLSFTGGVPSREMRAKALERAIARSDVTVSDYLRKMGVDQGLLAAAHAVKFESIHILTRDEIAAFGIDPRQRVETSWTVEQFNRSLVYKSVVERGDDRASFRTTRLQLFCLDANQYELHFQRPTSPPGGSTPSVRLAFGAEKLAFLYPPRSERGQEAWALRMSVERAVTLASSPEITVTETDGTGDGYVSRTDRFEGEGLREPLLRLMATCPPRDLSLSRAVTGSPRPPTTRAASPAH